jgi:hypothetical protein
MTLFRAFVLVLAAIGLTVAPALARGGGGGGGAAGGGDHGGRGVGLGHGEGPGSGVSRGGGRDTAKSTPGSKHRSSTATKRLSAPTPGKANPPSGVVPGKGKTGTVPTTPGHAP